MQVVCVMLVAFFYTYHWRSHALTLMCQYALLYACVRFRRQQIEVLGASVPP